MLKKWKLANFKVVNAEISLSLAPFTILVGENSSGKSTILQSMLLLAQTLKASESRQPLVLNGEYLRLGYMGDVVHDDNKLFPVKFGFVLQISDLPSNNDVTVQHHDQITLDFSVQAQSDDASEAILQTMTLTSGSNDLFSMERVRSKKGTLLDKDENKDIVMLSSLRSQINNGNFDYNVSRVKSTRGKWLNHVDEYLLYGSLYRFLPNYIIETFDALNLSLTVILKASGKYLGEKGEANDFLIDATSRNSRLAPPLDVTNFRDPHGNRLKEELIAAIKYAQLSLDDTRFNALQSHLPNTQKELERSESLKEWLMSVKQSLSHTDASALGESLFYQASILERTRSQPVKRVGASLADLPESIQAIRAQIVEFFCQHIYYLGPLREDPHYIYSLPPYPELSHVGLKGEFTASVLDRYKDEYIEYPLPPSTLNGVMKTGKGRLIVALRQWLDYMGLLQDVKTTDRGKVGTELTVKAVGVNRELDLASIGVGVSQVLPTLVMGLISPSGTTLLLEQPELHLHPKVQSMVADFLLGLTKVGKQCIVETHSEYLVNRLRRRVAEDETNQLQEQASIYFVERQAGESKFRQLDLNEYGALLDWPAGFFDEGPNEAELIVRAALKKHGQGSSNAESTKGG